MNKFAFTNHVCHLDCGTHRVPVYVKDITMTTDGTTYMVEEVKRPELAMYTDYVNYFRYDLESTAKMIGMYKIKNVIFNDPATIVFWTDGTKTVVKAENEPFDPEKGLAMAIAKKHFGNKGNYFNEIKKWTDGYDVEPLYPWININLHTNKFADDKLKLMIENRVAEKKKAANIEYAYRILCDIYIKKKATKGDLTMAIREAIGYLSEPFSKD